MALFRRKPKLQDEPLGELTEMFFSDPDDPTPGSELLDASRLDFSVKSLEGVDDYLDKMRKRELDDEAMSDHSGGMHETAAVVMIVSDPGDYPS